MNKNIENKLYRGAVLSLIPVATVSTIALVGKPDFFKLFFDGFLIAVSLLAEGYIIEKFYMNRGK
jgi:hypothetical protein